MRYRCALTPRERSQTLEFMSWEALQDHYPVTANWAIAFVIVDHQGKQQDYGATLRPLLGQMGCDRRWLCSLCRC